MDSQTARRVWVTGASSGLGLALVEQLLEQGALVAASGRASEELQHLARLHATQMLLLDCNLLDPLDAAMAVRQIADRWGALDCLLINAGTCDYLAVDTPAPAIFEGIVNSNLNASNHCLNSALPLLQGGGSPQVVAILSRYSSLQIYHPSQPARPDNNLAELLNSHRTSLSSQGIDLTVIAPLSLKQPVVSVQVVPEQWTAQSAADVILKHLPERKANLVLEAMHQNDLWPLPA